MNTLRPLINFMHISVTSFFFHNLDAHIRETSLGLKIRTLPISMLDCGGFFGFGSNRKPILCSTPTSYLKDILIRRVVAQITMRVSPHTRKHMNPITWKLVLLYMLLEHSHI